MLEKSCTICIYQSKKYIRNNKIALDTAKENIMQTETISFYIYLGLISIHDLNYYNNFN